MSNEIRLSFKIKKRQENLSEIRKISSMLEVDLMTCL